MPSIAMVKGMPAARNGSQSAAVAGKVIVSIVGPRKQVDAARLGKVAPVTIVPKAQLFGY